MKQSQKASDAHFYESSNDESTGSKAGLDALHAGKFVIQVAIYHTNVLNWLNTLNVNEHF